MPSTKPPIKVGILGIQGAFFEHNAALQNVLKTQEFQNKSIEVLDIRTPDQLTDDLIGLIIPGGESTTMSIFLRNNHFEKVLRTWLSHDRHVVWGTCAGLILLAEDIEHQKQGGQVKLGGLDVTVSRNYFGRQIQSFEAPITILDESLQSKSGTDAEERSVFIRAPAVTSVNNPKVKVLAVLNQDEQRGPVTVAVQQGNAMATAFHPELTNDLRWHKYFLDMVMKCVG